MIIKLWGMSLIAGLEAFALSQGIDGTLFSLVIAGISGLAGYQIAKAQPQTQPQPIKKRVRK